MTGLSGLQPVCFRWNFLSAITMWLTTDKLSSHSSNSCPCLSVCPSYHDAPAAVIYRSSGTVSQKKSLDSPRQQQKNHRSGLKWPEWEMSSIGIWVLGPQLVVLLCVEGELGSVALLNCWRTMASGECFESEEPHLLPCCPLCSMLRVTDVNCQLPAPGAMLSSGCQASQSQPTL